MHSQGWEDSGKNPGKGEELGYSVKRNCGDRHGIIQRPRRQRQLLLQLYLFSREAQNLGSGQKSISLTENIVILE